MAYGVLFMVTPLLRDRGGRTTALLASILAVLINIIGNEVIVIMAYSGLRM